MEGHNGVGKTMAVRLLEIATGTQPYTATSEWKSLKAHLPEVLIEIVGLADGATLKVRLTPARWHDAPAAAASDPECLGEAFLNGERIRLATVREVLRVFRIAGDDTIANRFAAMIAGDARLAAEQRATLEKSITNLEASVDLLARDVPIAAPAAVSDFDRKRSELRKQREAAEQSAKAAEQRGTAVETLSHLVAARDELRERGPEIDLSLAQLNAEIESLQRMRVQLAEQQSRLLPETQRKQALLKQMAALIKKREKDVEQARLTVATVRESMAALSVSVGSDDPTLGFLAKAAKALQQAQSAAEAERSAAIREKASLTASLDVVRLIERVEAPLNEAQAFGLDDQPVAILENTPVSARTLREGTGRCKQEIIARQRPPALEEVETRIAMLVDRLRDGHEAVRTLQAAGRAEERLRHTERDVESVSASLASLMDDAYQHVVAELKRVEDDYVAKIGERVALIHAKGTLTREGDEAELTARIDAIRADSTLHGDLPTVMALVARDQAKAEAAAKEAAAALVALESEQSAFERRLAEAVDLFAKSESYSWLRAAIGDRLPHPGLPAEESLRRFGELDRALGQLRADLDDLTTRAAATSDVIERLSFSIGKPFSGTNIYRAPFSAYYADQFGRLLRSPDVASVLFGEGGQFERVDLTEGLLHWRDSTGRAQDRPIEAFSSGERAFAYVLASVLEHAHDHAQNRLLVLDEFGAFIEAGRLDRLLRFLREEVLVSGQANQVIIILPLQMSGDLAAASQDPGQSEIVARGYSARDVTR